MSGHTKLIETSVVNSTILTPDLIETAGHTQFIETPVVSSSILTLTSWKQDGGSLLNIETPAL